MKLEEVSDVWNWQGMRHELRSYEARVTVYTHDGKFYAFQRAELCYCPGVSAALIFAELERSLFRACKEFARLPNDS